MLIIAYNNKQQNMTDKCYRVEFTAHLHKLTLALKMQCQIQVVWKRGQKVSESGKVILQGGQAKFDRKISISCNMIFNTKNKVFKQKITKFSIILTSEKGVKQAGEISLDVAQYINEKQLNKKDYETKLSGCPDKNAKLSFTLTGVLKQQISMDGISDRSYSNPVDQQVPEQITSLSKIVGPSQNKSSENNQNQNKNQPVGSNNRGQGKNEKIKQIEDENRKIKEELKMAEKLKLQNEQLRKKIKGSQFKKAQDVKHKIQKYKKQIQNIKSEIRAHKKIEDQTLQIEKDILNCKIKIMKAFNYANQYQGPELVDAIQYYCGILQK